jgi:hypothetical protein
MAKAALLEHVFRSSSAAMIFFTRATKVHARQQSFHGNSQNGNIRGSDTAPVGSFAGAIGVLLYGILEAENSSQIQDARLQLNHL